MLKKWSHSSFNFSLFIHLLWVPLRNLWCLGCLAMWLLLSVEGVDHFLHMKFFYNLFWTPHLLVYICQLVDLYSSQLISTSATPSISPRNRGGVHWCIDDETLESIVGIKFGTPKFDVSSACSSKTSWRFPCVFFAIISITCWFPCPCLFLICMFQRKT